MNILLNRIKKLGKIHNIWNELQNLGVEFNRYSSVTFPEVQALHNALLADLAARKHDYDQEKQRQLEMEEKRKEFAQKANDFVEHVHRREGEIEALNSEPDPRVLMEKILEHYSNGDPENAALKDLSALANEMAQMGIRNNSHTKHTMPSLTLQNKSFF